MTGHAWSPWSPQSVTMTMTKLGHDRSLNLSDETVMRLKRSANCSVADANISDFLTPTHYRKEAASSSHCMDDFGTYVEVESPVCAL